MKEVQLYVGDALGRYGFPNGHPFGPDRQDAFWKEAEKQGLPKRVTLREPRAGGQHATSFERFHILCSRRARRASLSLTKVIGLSITATRRRIPASTMRPQTSSALRSTVSTA